MAVETGALSEADYTHRAALRAVEGIGIPKDWRAAVKHLERAAELGMPLAQAELAALSGKWSLAHNILAGEVVERHWWSRFHRSVDLTKWVTDARTQIISDAPRMGIVKGLATPEVCDWLIARAHPRLQRAQVYDETRAEIRTVIDRTNSDSVFPEGDRDLFMALLRVRIAEVTEMPVSALEPPEILHYSVGQEYRRHYDSPADPNAPGFRPRLISLLLSLSEGYEGGETEFPIVPVRWKGRKGTAIFFSNVGPDGARDPRSLHAGLPITRGEKWILTQFIGRPKEAESSRS